MIVMTESSLPVVVVPDGDTVRYPQTKDEAPNFARVVEVNGAHITAKMRDGRTINIRGGHGGNLGDDWYDTDHAAFMRAIHEAEACLKRLLVAAGCDTYTPPTYDNE